MTELKDPRGPQRRSYPKSKWGRGTVPDDGDKPDRRGERVNVMSVDEREAFEWFERANLQIKEGDPFAHTMIYSETGVGKSSMAANMPRALIMACDRHGNWIFKPEARPTLAALFPGTVLQFHAAPVTTYRDIWRAYKILEKGCMTGVWPNGTPLWSWVIDGLNELQAGRMDSILEDTGHDVPELHDYKTIGADFRTLMLRFFALPMYGLVTCGIRNKGSQEHPFWGPDLAGRSADEIPNQCDIVGRLGMTASARRVVMTAPGESFVTKDLTSHLNGEEGQNIQAWFAKIYGADWRKTGPHVRKVVVSGAELGAPGQTVDQGPGENPPPIDVDSEPVSGASSGGGDVDVPTEPAPSSPDLVAAGYAASITGVIEVPAGSSEVAGRAHPVGAAHSEGGGAPLAGPAPPPPPRPAMNPHARLAPYQRTVVDRIKEADPELGLSTEIKNGEIFIWLPSAILKALGFKDTTPAPVSLLDLDRSRAVMICQAIDSLAKTGAVEVPVTPGEQPELELPAGE